MRKIISIFVIIHISLFILGVDTIMSKEDSIIKLPQPNFKSTDSFEELILKRRSIRNFIDKELTELQVSQLLWAAQGITDTKRGLRAAPSAGALYPMEIFLVKKDGLFHYLPHTHSIQMLKTQDLRNDLSVAALGQTAIQMAPCSIVIVAIYERVTSKYGNRGMRYVNIEAGHIAENIHLEAVSLGLGSVPIGAFDDRDVQRILQLPKDYVPLYIIPIGHKLE